MDPSDLPIQPAGSDLIDKASRCVACGLCLPHCPTYRKTLSEADSPRGRIALMRGVLEGRIPPNGRFAEHIDLCLTCRACEAACPNGVAYGRLVDGVRSFVDMRRASGSRGQCLRDLAMRELATRPARLQILARMLRLYQRSGLQRLLRGTGVLDALSLGELEAQLPPLARRVRWRRVYPAAGRERGAVALFLGCVARITDVATLQAAIFVLNRLGYTVHVPARQTCCGALHQHSGESDKAAELARQNLSAFEGLKLAGVISTASGCGAQLQEYHFVDGEDAAEFSAKVIDVNAFLDRAEGWDGIEFRPLAGGIAVHEPCSQRNVMRATAHVYRLLRRIPQAVVEPLAGNDQCCGAAGTYFLDQPEMANRLLDDKIRAVSASGAHIVATSNVGCAMYFGSALRGMSLNIEVAHPVTILARQMGFNKV